MAKTATAGAPPPSEIRPVSLADALATVCRQLACEPTVCFSGTRAQQELALRPDVEQSRLEADAHGQAAQDERRRRHEGAHNRGLVPERALCEAPIRPQREHHVNRAAGCDGRGHDDHDGENEERRFPRSPRSSPHQGRQEQHADHQGTHGRR